MDIKEFREQLQKDSESKITIEEQWFLSVAVSLELFDNPSNNSTLNSLNQLLIGRKMFAERAIYHNDENVREIAVDAVKLINRDIAKLLGLEL